MREKFFSRWEHGSYGNCYTMVIAREHYSFIGPFHGLSLTLHTQDDEYLAKSTEGAGFQVAVWFVIAAAVEN